MGEGCLNDRVRAKKKSTDQRKPFGCTIIRIIFPSKEKILQRILPSNLADKIAGDGQHEIGDCRLATVPNL